MKAIEKIIERASALNGTVVLPEGMDARVIVAACSCVDRKICTPVVLGTPEEIAERYGSDIVMQEEMPPIDWPSMGRYVYMAKFKEREEMERYFAFVLG